MPHIKPLISCMLFLLLFPCYNGLFAQSNFYKFTAGAGYGLTLPYPDAQTVVDFAGYVNLDYNLTPYMILGVELQKGKLTGGEASHGFSNKFTTLTLNAKLYVGEFLTSRDLNNAFLKSIRGIYGGVGVGVIKNDVVFEKLGVPGQGINRDVLFPFNAGYNLYFPNRWGYSRFILNFNIQASVFLEDGLDGDLNTSSNFNDIYNFYSVGVKYNFGPLGLDRKR